MGDVVHSTTTTETNNPAYDVSADAWEAAHTVPTNSIVKNNFTATTNPTANEDSGDGYEVGSRWVNTTLKRLFTCLDASVGAAIWQEELTFVGSADFKPASPNAANDEFDTTDTSDPMTGWTTLSSPTAHDMNSTRKSHYYVKGPTGSTGAAQVGIYKAWTPSNGDTWTVKVSGSTMFNDNYVRNAQFWLAETGPGKVITMNYVQGGGGARWEVNSYTAPGTFGSVLATIGGQHTLPPPCYLRIVFNTSTDISYFVSMDGFAWTHILLNHNPSFTVAFIGMGVEASNASRQPEAYFDWIRKNWTPGS